MICIVILKTKSPNIAKPTFKKCTLSSFVRVENWPWIFEVDSDIQARLWSKFEKMLNLQRAHMYVYLFFSALDRSFLILLTWIC